MIWVNDINVVNRLPAQRPAAFDGVEFTVVVDAFMTTPRSAHLVLPCTLMLEQQDIVGSFCTSVQYAAAVVDPPPEGAYRSLDRPSWSKRLVLGGNAQCGDCLRARSDVALSRHLEELGQVCAFQPAPDRLRGLRLPTPTGNTGFLASCTMSRRLGRIPLRLLTLVRRTAIHSRSFRKTKCICRRRVWHRLPGLEGAGPFPTGGPGFTGGGCR
jgi:hypothetical protein